MPLLEMAEPDVWFDSARFERSGRDYLKRQVIRALDKS
jgi:hypothetical protein